MVASLSEEKTDPLFTSSLVGHEAAERAFLDSFNSERLHHAWLVTGPRGVGKATLAWRIAKFLLSSPVGDDGDGLFGETLATDARSLDVNQESPEVQRILAGGHGNIRYITRTENPTTGKLRKDIGIDDIRGLISFFGQTSAEEGWRIAIVDSADEMNVSAANAILKLLEEPPARSIIFMLAHSPGKLLPTIRSRCRHLPLAPLSADSVKAVLAGRFPTVSADELDLLSRLAEGAPGRAVTIATEGGVELYRNVQTLFASLPQYNIAALHTLAGKLAQPKADARYRLFYDFALGFIERLIRYSAAPATDSIYSANEADIFIRLIANSRVDQWLDLWEKVGERRSRGDAVNLDRKQLIINFAASAASVAKGS